MLVRVKLELLREIMENGVLDYEAAPKNEESQWRFYPLKYEARPFVKTINKDGTWFYPYYLRINNDFKCIVDETYAFFHKDIRKDIWGNRYPCYSSADLTKRLEGEKLYFLDVGEEGIKEESTSNIDVGEESTINE